MNDPLRPHGIGPSMGRRTSVMLVADTYVPVMEGEAAMPLGGRESAE